MIEHNDMSLNKHLRNNRDRFNFSREMLSLYYIQGSNDSAGEPLETIEFALKGGITCFQYREKGTNALEGQEKINFAKRIQSLCHQYEVPFIVNDDVELALHCDADGIHVGQDDTSIEEIYPHFKEKIIGLSVGNKDEYSSSKDVLQYVDYIGTGPVYNTVSKHDAGDSIGIKGIQQMRVIDQRMPMVAIGGIQSNHIQSIIEAGADGVAVISSISRAKDPELATRKLREVLNQVKR